MMSKPLLSRKPVQAALLATGASLLGRLCGPNGITGGIGLSICYWAFRSSAEEDAAENIRIKEAVEKEKLMKKEYADMDGSVYSDDSIADALRARLSEDAKLSDAPLGERPLAVSGDLPSEPSASSTGEAPADRSELDPPAPSQADIDRLNRMFGKSDE